MNQLWNSRCFGVVATLLLVSCPVAADAQTFVPDQLVALPKLTYGDIPSTLNITFPQIVPLNGSPFPIQETNMMAAFPPSGTEGGKFERNEHIVRFRKASAGDPITGHAFQRSEAWDFSFNVQIDQKDGSPRKEAGIYFESPLGNAIFTAYTNPGFYDPGAGTITTIFENVIPAHSFANVGGGPLGDYNLNGLVDAADYTIWRDTLGSTTDFRANGNNDGASENKIDQADYDVWKAAFGDGALNPPGISYEDEDVASMRLVYTPPVLDPEVAFDVNNPAANVLTPATMEYIVSINGGPLVSSGVLDFTNSWLGLPNGTLISLRAQNISTASASPDFVTTTFSNFDFDGPGAAVSVPEPASLFSLASILLGVVAGYRRRVE